MNTTVSDNVHGTSLFRTANAVRNSLSCFPMSLLAFAFRVAVATVFFRSALSKLASWDATVALFEMEYMVPFLPAPIAAFLATATELVCSMMLVAGVGTRIAAAALLGLTLVIQFLVYPENWPDHLLWGSILAFLLTRGGGALSIDHIVGRALLPKAN